MKKKFGLLLASISLMGSLIVGFGPNADTAAAEGGIVQPFAVNYSDTDLISIWRVTSNGQIYSPVSVITSVQINSTTSGSNLLATKRELVSETPWGSFEVYPNAKWGPGVLNIRGSNVSLPKKR